MKYKRIWAVTANGRRARIVENLGAGDDSETIVELENEDATGVNLFSDKPGRSFASEGKGRSAMEYHSDPVRERERHFARRISDHLARSHGNGQFRKLVVTASPRTLGDLRQMFPASLNSHIVAEIDKDFTLLPANELKMALVALLQNR